MNVQSCTSAIQSTLYNQCREGWIRVSQNILTGDKEGWIDIQEDNKETSGTRTWISSFLHNGWLRKSSHQCVRRSIPRVLTGYFFHSSQNVHTKTKSIGLAGLYMEDQDFGLRMIIFQVLHSYRNMMSSIVSWYLWPTFHNLRWRSRNILKRHTSDEDYQIKHAGYLHFQLDFGVAYEGVKPNCPYKQFHRGLA